MKNFKYLLLLLYFSANAQVLTLEQCYQLARENYPLIKRNELLSKSKDYTIENISKNWLPQINISAQATYQSDVTELPIKIPNATIEPLSKDQYKVFADINQTIFDGGMISNQKKIAELQSQTEIQKNEVELEKLKDRINQLFFGIIQTKEQINQLELSKNDVQNGLNKAEAQLKYGTILRSNVDVLKAQLINLEQQQIELKSLKNSFVQMLSSFINKNLDENVELQKPEKLLLTNENNRPELKLFDLQKQLSESQKSLIKAKIFQNSAHLFKQVTENQD